MSSSPLPPSPQRASIKPVYNVGDYGFDFDLQMGTDGNLTLESIISSTSTFQQNTVDVGTFTATSPVQKTDLVFTDINTFGILHEGVDTAFNQVFSFEPDMTAFSYEFSIIMGFGLKVTVQSAGNFAIDGVRFTITQQVNSEQNIPIDDFVIPSTLANITATGSQIFTIIGARHYDTLKLIKGRPVTVQVQVIETTGTGTRYIGIMPLFPFQALNIIRPCTSSHITAHLHASLDHAYPVFRDQSAMQLLDYSGRINLGGSGL